MYILIERLESPPNQRDHNRDKQMLRDGRKDRQLTGNGYSRGHQTIKDFNIPFFVCMYLFEHRLH